MASAEYILRVITQFTQGGEQAVFASLRQELEALAQRAQQLSAQEVSQRFRGTTQEFEAGARQIAAGGTPAGQMSPAQAQSLLSGLNRVASEIGSRLQAAVPGFVPPRGVATNLQAAGQAAEQASIREEIAERVASARARANETAQIEGLLASDRGYAEAQARATRAKAEISANVQQELASSRGYAEANARAARARAEISAVEQEELASTTGFAEANARASRAKAEIAAATQEELASTTEYAAANARAAQAKAEIAAETRAQIVGLSRGAGEGTSSLQGRTIAAEQVRTAEQRLVTERTILANKNGELDAIVAERRAQAELNSAIQAQVRAARGQGHGTILEGGSLFQRLQAQIRVRQNPDQVIDPTQFLNVGQFIGSRALTTAGFAASGAAIYAVTRGLREEITYAEQLDKVMSQVRAEFEALGQGNQYQGFRSQILGIARDTGQAATEVAQIGILMKGAFQDTPTALAATRQTIEAMQVTGLSGSEAVNTFIALAKSFGITVQDVSDKALGLQDRFGVMSKEIVQGASTIAPIAQQVGLDFNQLASIVAAGAQATGRPAQSIAEGLGRVLPQLQKNAASIITLYSQVPALRPHLAEVQADFASGREGQVLPRLIRDWSSLTLAQQNATLALLGGRREAQALAAVLDNNSKAVQELDGRYNDTGRTQRGFADLQGSLVQSLARMRQELLQIGDSLARLGVLDAFKVAFGGLDAGLQVLGTLLRILSSINNVAGGIPGHIIAIVAAIKLLQLASGFFGGGGISGALAQVGPRLGLGPAAAAAPVAISEAEVLAELGGLAGTTAAARAGLLSRAAGAGRGALGFFGGIGGANIPRLGGIGTGLGAGGLGAGGLFGAGSASLGALTLGVGAADYFALSYDARKLAQVRNQSNQAQQINRQQFSSETLQQLLANRATYNQPSGREVATDLLTGKIGFGDAIRGRSSAQIDQATAIAKATQDNFDKAVDAGLFSAFNQDEIKKLRAQVDKSGGRGDAGKRAQSKLAALNKDHQRQLRDLVGQARTNKQAADAAAAGDPTQFLITAQDLTDAYAAGTIDYPRFIAGLKEQLANQQKADTNPSSNPELHKQTLALLKQVRDAESAHLDQVLAESEAEINLNYSLSRDPAAQAQRTKALALAALTRANARPDADPTKLAAQDAALTAINQADLAAQDVVDQNLRARSSLRQAQANRDPAAVANIRLAQARADLATAQREGRGQAAVDQAQQAVVEAQQAASDASQAISSSQLNLLKAQHPDDRIAQARIAQQQADLAARDAHGKAAQLDALAQRVAADRQMQDAIAAISDSRLNLLQAEATASGDDIGAARIGVQLAQAALDRARQQGADEGKVNDLQAALDTQQANLRHTTISSTEDQISRDLQLRRITTAQAIARLRALESVAKNQKETDEIELRIQQLMQQAGQNYTFDLPSTIKLPTLYEVRRFQSAGDNPANYDQRQINLQLYINNGMDETRARQFLSDVLGGATGTVSRVRRV